MTGKPIDYLCDHKSVRRKTKWTKIPTQESQSKGKTEQCKRTVRLAHQRNSPFLTNRKKKVHFRIQNDPRNHQHGNGSFDDLQKPTATALQHTYLFSAAATFMASIMFFTVSIICLALIVCCSNLVFTADCEIHSCEEPKPQHITAIPYQHLLEFHCQKALAAISMNLNPWETKRENIQKSKDNRIESSNESIAAGLYLHTFKFIQ